MSGEFYIRFESFEWYQNNQKSIASYLSSLPCFIEQNNRNEFWLLGLEDRNLPERWEFDMRLFFKKQFILLEISGHPDSVSKDLMKFLNWLRERTSIIVQDEDGEPFGW
ncbi:unnamed protein product [Commensalibacter communis]|nr:hypothetical protein [Commensalibacter communis]CAI3922749.1 unnamed protein product [Commensalibacter communis]